MNEMNWFIFAETQPPDVVEDYITIDIYGNVSELQWYEGDCFKNCSGGNWIDKDGNLVDNIIYWINKPQN